MAVFYSSNTTSAFMFKPKLTPAAALSSPPSLPGRDTSTFFDSDTRPIMLFDGVCNLCNGGVKFVKDNDRNRRIRYEALQSDAGKKLLRRSGRAPDDISSVVLVEKNCAYIKSEAVLKIMEYIDMPYPQLAFFLHFVPLFLRDFVYNNVANNRTTYVIEIYAHTHVHSTWLQMQAHQDNLPVSDKNTNN